jgi:hypothetical protein
MANLAPYSWDTDAIETDPLAIDVTDRLFPAYVKDVVQLAFGRSLLPQSGLKSRSVPDLKPPKFVYTPMHGVGMRIFDRVMYSLGFEGPMYPVDQQVVSSHSCADTRHFPTPISPRSSSPIRKKRVHFQCATRSNFKARWYCLVLL